MAEYIKSIDKIKRMPTSMFLSGVESNTYWNIVVKQGGIRNVLTSYHYFKKKPRETLKERLEETPDVNVFIDSGAFTFFSKGQDHGEEFWEEYIIDYTEWARENKDYIFAIANLDIEAIVGQEKVLEWNKKYFEPLEKEGILVCYIWHGLTGTDTWEDYCRKYDYVGFSSDGSTQLTIQQRNKLVNVAKKHGAVIHGMALTETSMLVRVPMFSVDSTTWIVGQQYGELNWFDGRKMKRLSKKEWQRNYKTKLLKEPFNADWDKLINGMGGRGDTYELLRLNVIAYKLAEEHIRKRLGKKMYWLSGNSNNSGDNLKKLGEINLPTREWFDGDMSDYQKYLDELGITVQASKDELLDVLYDFYVYLSMDSVELDKLNDEDILDSAKTIVGVDTSDRDEAIKELNRYYIDNATGVRNDYKDEMESMRAQERDFYIEDEEFEVIDLTQEELQQSNLLPAPREDNSMPEIDAYDEELKKQGIVAVRDDKGRFLKGQKKVRKPKNVYSKKYPRLHCQTCYKSGDCPEYRDGYVCAFDKTFNKFNTRNTEDVVDAMSSMVEMNLGRLQKAMIFETMDGGMPTGEVTGLIDQNMKLLEKMKDLNEHNPKTVVQQRRVINADGTETVDTSMAVNPNSGGILSAIFGAPSTASDEDEIDEDDNMAQSSTEVKSEPKEDAIDVDYTVIDVEPVEEPTKETKEEPTNKKKKLKKRLKKKGK